MRYFVIGPDGSRYGPADLSVLRVWTTQGRITPDTVLEEEASRQRVPARMVAGVIQVETPGPAVQPYAGARPEFSTRADSGTHDLLWSYVCSALTLICCLPFIVGGFVYANRALGKGNPRARYAKIFAWIMLIIWIVSTPIEIAMLGRIMDYLTSTINSGRFAP